MEKKKILVGMSGGVDSSVSALLLKQQGYEVIGAMMQLWQNPKMPNGAEEDAKRICELLQIPFYVFNCKKEFEQYVIHDFVQEYERARTPNPCIRCNRYLKFGYFLEKAKELDCDFIATGHYAKTEYSEKYGQMVLKKADAIGKDQSYFLYHIPKEVIPMLVFPLASYVEKEETRNIAEEYGLPVAKKKDSQEICFIPEGDYGEFLEKNGAKLSPKGNFVLSDGTKVGEHKGLMFYTIGQRKGLGISYQEPLYVIKMNKEENAIIVGTEAELYQDSLIATDLNFLVEREKIQESDTITAKIRYRAKEANCTIALLEKDRIKVMFQEPQKSITPGQSVVFYDGDIVLGGGIIA